MQNDDQEIKTINKQLGYFRNGLSLSGDDKVNFENNTISFKQIANYNLFNTSFKIDDDSDEFLSDEEIEQPTFKDKYQAQGVANFQDNNNINNTAPVDDLDDDSYDQPVNAGEPKPPVIKTLFSAPKKLTSEGYEDDSATNKNDRLDNPKVQKRF